MCKWSEPCSQKTNSPLGLLRENGDFSIIQTCVCNETSIPTMQKEVVLGEERLRPLPQSPGSPVGLPPAWSWPVLLLIQLPSRTKAGLTPVCDIAAGSGECATCHQIVLIQELLFRWLVVISNAFNSLPAKR